LSGGPYRNRLTAGDGLLGKRVVLSLKRAPLNHNELNSAGELLYDLWRSGGRIDQLPLALRPTTRAEGYDIQARIANRSRDRLFGWKIAATSVAGQAHIGVDGPLAGRIPAECVLENHGTCFLRKNLMQVAELEFAFRMSADIKPRAAIHSVDEVMERVATLHPAIEIPDSRYEHFQSVGAPQLIADNACAHLFVIGSASPEMWRSLDLAAHLVWGTINDTARQPGLGRNVSGDPRTALTWLVNELSQHGIALRAGEVVTTGACLAPLRIAAGDRMRGDFGTLGEVSITIA
jgi:2-keto-4-pentenoate hydratase